jgi:hypothetical protein
VFQLNAVNRHNGRIQTFNDWQVGVPGFFGTNVESTLNGLRRPRDRARRDPGRRLEADLERRNREVHDRRLKTGNG